VPQIQLLSTRWFTSPVQQCKRELPKRCFTKSEWTPGDTKNEQGHNSHIFVFFFTARRFFSAVYAMAVRHKPLVLSKRLNIITQTTPSFLMPQIFECGHPHGSPNTRGLGKNSQFLTNNSLYMGNGTRQTHSFNERWTDLSYVTSKQWNDDDPNLSKYVWISVLSENKDNRPVKTCATDFRISNSSLPE